MTWNERPEPDLAARIDAALERAIAEKRIVGGVVLVARDGAIAARRTIGLADREQRVPMREDTPFRQASLTKAITSVVALDLVARGALSLDDTAERWLPRFTPGFGGEKAAITVRQLLTHTSGLGYPFHHPEELSYGEAYVSSGLDQPGLSLEENLRRLASAPLFSKPGTTWRYSLSTDVLAAIVERAGDRSFAEQVEERVTKPLGMERTAFVPRDPAHLATPYADGKPEPVRMWDGIALPFRGGVAQFAPSRQLDAASYPSGGAGISGTASDYLRFLEALRTRHPFVARTALDEIFRDQIPSLTSPALGDGWGFGFGAAVLRDPGAAKVRMAKGTIRWGGAWGHAWWIDQEARLSAVLLTNTAFEGMAGRLYLDLVNAVWP